MYRVTIIGPGRLGGALAVALSRSGVVVENVVYRSTAPATWVEQVAPKPTVRSIDSLKSIDSDVVLLTTGDSEILSTAAMLANRLKPGSVALHTSGAMSSSELASLNDAGVHTGSMHPLLSVSDRLRGAESFAGAYFCLEGDPAAVMTARTLVQALGGSAFSIETRFKPLYHASAVLASGHITALFATAAKTLAACGLDNEFSVNALLPLLQSTVRNLEQETPADALTGPFARADVGTILRHLDAFEDAGLEAERRIYLELGQAALRLGEAKEIDRSAAAEIQAAIKLALESPR